MRFLKRTPTSDRLLADSELRYPYEGSKTLMHVFDRFEDADLIVELLGGMYAVLPEKKPKKASLRNCLKRNRGRQVCGTARKETEESHVCGTARKETEEIQV